MNSSEISDHIKITDHAKTLGSAEAATYIHQKFEALYEHHKKVLWPQVIHVSLTSTPLPSQLKGEKGTFAAGDIFHFAAHAHFHGKEISCKAEAPAKTFPTAVHTIISAFEHQLTKKEKHTLHDHRSDETQKLEMVSKLPPLEPAEIQRLDEVIDDNFRGSEDFEAPAEVAKDIPDLDDLIDQR